MSCGEVGSGSYVVSWFLGLGGRPGGGTHFVGRSTQGRVPIRIVGFSTSVPRGAGRIRRCHVAALVLCRENDKLPRGRS